MQAGLLSRDLHLPDMDGIDVLQHLLAEPRAGRARIVVVSADANPHQVSRLLATGAEQYLTKPLDVAEVFRLLDTPAEVPEAATS